MNHNVVTWRHAYNPIFMAIQSKMQENYIFIEKTRFHKKLDFQLKKKKNLFFHTVY